MDRPPTTVSISSSYNLIDIYTERFVCCVQGPDVLHPCASLEWTKCSDMPVKVFETKAVLLENKLYVVEIALSSHYSNPGMYIYNLATDEWSDKIDIPMSCSAPIIYRSKLVLVGGEKINTSIVTNQLFTMISLGQWRETIPPMSEERFNATAVEYEGNILVTGGRRIYTISNTVEVYNGLHWTKAQCLPKDMFIIKSIVFNGQWYMVEFGGNEYKVYYAPLDSLVASSQVSEKPVPSVWKRLASVPLICTIPAVIPAASTIPAVVGNRLIALDQYSDSIYAYSPHTQSWVIVGKRPLNVKILSSFAGLICSQTEFMVIGCTSIASVSSIYRVQLKGTITVVSNGLPTMFLYATCTFVGSYLATKVFIGNLLM